MAAKKQGDAVALLWEIADSSGLGIADRRNDSGKLWQQQTPKITNGLTV
jgi:hypothetical protein